MYWGVPTKPVISALRVNRASPKSHTFKQGLWGESNKMLPGFRSLVEGGEGEGAGESAGRGHPRTTGGIHVWGGGGGGGILAIMVSVREVGWGHAQPCKRPHLTALSVQLLGVAVGASTYNST
jgi:hypothetical protein